MQKNTFIYALSCPATGQVRYVGKSDNPRNRLQRHLLDAPEETNHRACWIRSLLAAKLCPVVEILDEVPDSEWQQWEAAYIDFFRERGCNLVNSTGGGEGVGSKEENPMFGKKQAPQTIAKRVAKTTGKKRTSEFCARNALVSLGKKHKNNTSGFVGISWEKNRRKWRASFRSYRKQRHIGFFSKLEDAVFMRALAIDNYGNH